MTTKHTPGEWVWVGGQLLANRGGHSDCVMIAADEPFGPSVEDARLIAAAPELLEALQVAASVMRTFANVTPTDGWAASKINAALRLADPALAKAGA